MANYKRELRIGVDIGEKEKGGKSNKVCRENEKISRGSWSSTKKSIRKNKETSRKMEERR